MKMKHWIRFFSAVLGLGVLSLAAHALEVTDERGVTVSLPQPPQRIVTLLPSLTEGVCALGACSRLVGVDNYSNSPSAVRAHRNWAEGWTPMSRPSWRCGLTRCCLPSRPA
jgi:iron complex transport system substrate-binding protein